MVSKANVVFEGMSGGTASRRIASLRAVGAKSATSTVKQDIVTDLGPIID